MLFYDKYIIVKLGVLNVQRCNIQYDSSIIVLFSQTFKIPSILSEIQLMHDRYILGLSHKTKWLLKYMIDESIGNKQNRLKILFDDHLEFSTSLTQYIMKEYHGTLVKITSNCVEIDI